jgi:hypothetical protein
MVQQEEIWGCESILEFPAPTCWISFTCYNTKPVVFLPSQKIHFFTVLFDPLKNKILGIDYKTAIQKPWCALETAIYQLLRAGTDV